jgi:hypothetical protein
MSGFADRIFGYFAIAQQKHGLCSRYEYFVSGGYHGSTVALGTSDRCVYGT